MDGTQNMLKIDNLHARVAGREILKGLSLDVKPGEVHAIMGPNGSGKSTLGYVLSGREGYEVTKGSVTFNGEDVTDVNRLQQLVGQAAVGSTATVGLIRDGKRIELKVSVEPMQNRR